MKKDNSYDLLVDFYKKKLSSDPKWVEQAIVRLYEYQTSEEKVTGETSTKNNVGFSGADSRTLSFYAKIIKGGKSLYGDYLEKAFKLTPKYAKQLISISDPIAIQKIIEKIQ